LEKELIEIRGRKDVIGKPLIYGTTEKFMEIFGLNSLDDLPGLREFDEEDLQFEKGDDHLIVENKEEDVESIPPVSNEEETEETKVDKEESSAEKEEKSEELLSDEDSEVALEEKKMRAEESISVDNKEENFQDEKEES